MRGSPWLVAAHMHEHVGDASRHLVRRCTDVGDPGRKAGLVGCLCLKHVAVRVAVMSGVTRPCEAAQTNARSRASASATGRRAHPVADHATASPQKAEAIGVTRFAK